MQICQDKMDKSTPLVIELVLGELNISYVWVTRTMIEKFSSIFETAGWVCESDSDVYTILKFFQEEGIVSLDIDHRGRVRQIKRTLTV